MIDARANITGLKEAEDIAITIAQTARAVARPALIQYAADLVGDARNDPYPPQLQGQVYDRTFAMQRGYDIEGEGDTVFFVNNTDRRRYVIDEEWQAKIHEGRHKTMQQRVRDTLPDFVETLQEKIVEAVRVV